MGVVSVCIPCTAAQDSLMVHQHDANHNNNLRLSLQLKRRSQHIIDIQYVTPVYANKTISVYVFQERFVKNFTRTSNQGKATSVAFKPVIIIFYRA